MKTHFIANGTFHTACGKYHGHSSTSEISKVTCTKCLAKQGITVPSLETRLKQMEERVQRQSEEINNLKKSITRLIHAVDKSLTP